MQGRSKRCLVTLFFLFANTAVYAGEGLLGHWSCVHANQNHALQFISASQLRFDGEVSNYMLMFGALVVEEEGEIVSYPLNLQGDALTITNPDGSLTRCKRGRAEPKGPSVAQPPRKGGGAPPVAQGRQAWPPYVKPAPPPGGYTGNESGIEYLVWKFAGRWAHVTANTLTNIYFKPDGTYEDAYEAGYSGQFTDQYGYQSGNWGAAGTEKGVGHWYPVGTLHQGKIYITKADGSQTVIHYKIQYRNGQYYPGEYYFNGKLYTVKYIYQ